MNPAAPVTAIMVCPSVVRTRQKPHDERREDTIKDRRQSLNQSLFCLDLRLSAFIVRLVFFTSVRPRERGRGLGISTVAR
jgi:hypothetical protein